MLVLRNSASNSPRLSLADPNFRKDFQVRVFNGDQDLAPPIQSSSASSRQLSIMLSFSASDLPEI